MRSIYRPPSIAKALEPYHYPEDEDGNLVPTPTPRAEPRSSTTDREVPVRVSALPMHMFLRRFGNRTRP
jgi:hypothetical protein